MSKDLAQKEDLAHARATASQIRQGIHNYLSTLALIDRAWREGHWKVLGYADWQGYVDGEFGEQRLRLPAEHRRKAVEELRLSGMSNRAIAATVGTDERTVRRDLAGAANAAPEEIKGTDGKNYASSRPSQPAPPPVEADAQLDAPDNGGVREDSTAPPVEDGERTGEPAAGPAGSPVPQAAAPASTRGGVDAGVSPSDLVNAIRGVLRFDVDAFAQNAGADQIEELGAAFELLDEFRSRALAALIRANGFAESKAA